MYDYSWDTDMIRTFLSENDSMWLNRLSEKKWAWWYHGKGFCQMYPIRYSEFINSKDFQDPYKQIDKCIDIWNDAKERWVLVETFNAYAFRFKNTGHLIFD